MAVHAHDIEGHAVSAAKRKRTKKTIVRRNQVDHAGPAEIILSESDDRYTSPDFIQSIEESFGTIDFDPCWDEASAVRPADWLDARRGDDGLHDDWRGGVAFVNPPWSQQKKWTERAHDQWMRGNVAVAVCLVPAKTDTDLFQDILSRDADLYLVRGRPRFFRKDGTSQSTMVSTMVVMFGATDEQKARFAERVDGLWCMLTRRFPTRFNVIAVVGAVAIVEYAPVSCAPSCPEGRSVSVRCNPFAELG